MEGLTVYGGLCGGGVVATGCPGREGPGPAH